MEHTAHVVHLELHTPERDRALAFYERLCGWVPELVPARGSSYYALDLGARVGGGVVECSAQRPLWLPYVDVADVGAATARARRLGARVMLPPREGPAGWRSVVSEPGAGELAFWQRKR